MTSSAVGVLALIVATQAGAQSTGAATGGGAGTTSGASAASPVAQPSVRTPAFDYQNTQAVPLPQSSRALSTGMDAVRDTANPSAIFGSPGSHPGEVGTGEKSPVQLAPARTILPSAAGAGATPEEYGTAGIPYTTSRANANNDFTVDYYPFRAGGKLYFQIGTANYVCSASLIGKGIVVTAAHCVILYGSGSGGWYHNWTFVPAYNNGTAPYGSWTANHARAMNVYINGTDSCQQRGVVCANDVAVLVLNANSKGQYPGPTTGWFAYGYNGYSYTGGKAQITQLGYPVALDGGVLMQRTDSQGTATSSMANNTIIGSLQTGGSSGGPWLVNLGMAPSLSGTSFGSAATHNVVVGVTSWGSTNDAVKWQGAAPFTSGNIVQLVNAECSTPHPWCYN